MILWSNNVQTTLAAPLAIGASTMTVAAGTGALFPNPTSVNDYFTITMTDAATETRNEIIYVTGRSGDVFTIDKGQEGTSDQAWIVGDIAGNLVTAGALEDIQQQISSINDILKQIPKSEWAAIKARTSNYNCTPALIAAAALGKIYVSMPGKYKFTAAYNGTTDFDVEASVDGVEFDLSSVSAANVIQNSGSLTALPALSTDIVAGVDWSCVFTSAPSLSIGDWVCFYDPTNFSYSGFRGYYRAGEFKQVSSISGATVNFTQPFYDSYDHTIINNYKLNSVICRLSNIKLIGGATPTGLVQFSLSSQAEYDRISFSHANNSALVFDRCVGGKFILPKGINVGDGGDDYGLVDSNSQHTRLYGGDIYARRHAVTTGGSDVVCAVPVRDFRCLDRAIIRNDPTTDVGSANMHGNVEDSSYEDCDIYGGASPSGQSTFYKRCNIYADSSGVVARISEVKGGLLTFEDCDFYTFSDPDSTGRGIIDIGGNSSGVVDSNTVIDFTVRIKRCTLNGKNLTSSTEFVKFVNRGAIVAINFDIDDITLDINTAISSILRTSVDSGTADSDFIIVDNIKSERTGIKLMTDIGPSYSNFKLKMMKQSGSDTVTTSTISPSPTFSGSPTTFKYVYPRQPRVQISRNSIGYIGNRIGIAYANPVSTTGLTTNISTDAGTNFSAAAAVVLDWTAEINEI